MILFNMKIWLLDIDFVVSIVFLYDYIVYGDWLYFEVILFMIVKIWCNWGVMRIFRVNFGI